MSFVLAAQPALVYPLLAGIITTQVNLFLGLDEPVTVCNPLDATGNEVRLDDEKFQIILQAKAPSYNAPTRVVLDKLGENLEV
eukprot:3941644-Rhodomonas_salina.25